MKKETGDTGWMEMANCKSYPPALFFPSDGIGVDRARRICAPCPVSEECLDYALENRIAHGVWGGTSERERRKILKNRRTTLFENPIVHRDPPTPPSK